MESILLPRHLLLLKDGSLLANIDTVQELSNILVLHMAFLKNKKQMNSSHVNRNESTNQCRRMVTEVDSNIQYSNQKMLKGHIYCERKTSKICHLVYQCT